jgi:hypothetical protein
MQNAMALGVTDVLAPEGGVAQDPVSVMGP